MKLNSNPVLFPSGTNSVVKVCGTPYAVCVAETPEEAEALNQFMESVKNGTTPTPHQDVYTLQDCNGFPDPMNDIKECKQYAYSSFEDAKDTANNWCLGASNYYSVIILKNGIPYCTYSLDWEPKEKIEYL